MKHRKPQISGTAKKKKTKGRVATWATALRREEAEEVDKAIANAGLSKAEFVRQAAEQLKKG